MNDLTSGDDWFCRKKWLFKAMFWWVRLKQQEKFSSLAFTSSFWPNFSILEADRFRIFSKQVVGKIPFVCSSVIKVGSDRLSMFFNKAFINYGSKLYITSKIYLHIILLLQHFSNKLNVWARNAERKKIRKKYFIQSFKFGARCLVPVLPVWKHNSD